MEGKSPLNRTLPNDALASLEKLAETALAWPIDFRRVVEIKRLMEQLKYGELDELIAVTHSAAAKLSPVQHDPSARVGGEGENK
jgi:hypothetical protein